YTLHSNPEILDMQRRMALALNLPVVWGTSAHLNGRSLSAARDLGVPAIYAEWG
ncbi:MAG TPA: succinylglutamate desuccinylase, partial [Planctomycetaceae bacterium]|nr:succinylglutamate desuccinylase [Planctomycetaceae bacterium]